MVNPLSYFWGRKKEEEELSLQFLFQTFRELLDYNNQALDLMADMGEKLGGDYLFDKQYIETVITQLEEVVYKIVYDLNLITPKKYLALFDVFEKAKMEIQGELGSRFTLPKGELVYPIGDLTKEMSDYVGEKMATLGELRNRLGLKVPEGFVISTYAFKRFIETNRLEEWVAPLSEGKLNQEVTEEKAKELREQILKAKIPPEIKKAIRKILPSWEKVSPDGWAVRSSAVGEDSQISYAGQYTTVLNVSPSEIDSGYKQVVASLFSPQVIIYRKERGIKQQEMAMAVGCLPMIVPMVSGVIYTADPTGLEGEEMILAACWGLGKLVVDGEGEVDQYKVSKTPPLPRFVATYRQKVQAICPLRKRGDCLGPGFSGKAGNTLSERIFDAGDHRRGHSHRAIYEILPGYRVVHRSEGTGHLSPGQAPSIFGKIENR